MEDYDEGSLDYEELVENVLNIETAAELQLLSLSAEKWNQKSREVKLSEMNTREAIALPTLVDESGDLFAMDYGPFEPATHTAVWLAEQKRDRMEVDDLNTNVKGMESQLNRWLRERNWKPMIRDMWVEWLRKSIQNNA